MDFQYLAIYFCMGMYNKDDNVSSDVIGFDCPFDDSPVLYAKDEAELERKIKEVYEGESEEIEGDWEGIYPDVICDNQGTILVDPYRRITTYKQFDPDREKYSFGRETLAQLWEREKWQWI